MVEDAETATDELKLSSSREEPNHSASHSESIAVSTADRQEQMQTLLANITNKAQLLKIINELDFTADTIRMIREQLPSGPERTRVLNFAAEIFLDSWKRTPPYQSAKMATLLSQTWNDWKPTDEIAQRLIAVCERAMRDQNTAKIAALQPMIYALGAVGKLDLYGKWLHTTTTQELWREADLARNKTYYASGKGTPRKNQLAAIERHLQDPNRTGLLRAHDVGLLFQIGKEYLAEGLGSNDPDVQRTRNLLADTVYVLRKHQQNDLVAYIEHRRVV